MATVKLDLRKGKKDVKPDGTCPIILRVFKNGINTEIRLGYYIDPKFWDPILRTLKSRPTMPNRKLLVQLLDTQLNLANQIVYALDINKPNWNLKDFKFAFKSGGVEIKAKTLIFPEIERQIKLLEAQEKWNQVGNLETLKAAFERTNHQIKYFEEITPQWCNMLYREYLERGLKGRNVFKDLRSLYNKVIKMGLVSKEYYPFGQHGFSLPKAEKQEKGISMDQYKMLINFQGTQPQEEAVKYFLIMTYFVGMEFVDLAQLRKKNIVNGRLEYRRGKNQKYFSYAIIPQAQNIIDEISTAKKPDDYLFQIMDPTLNPKSKEYATMLVQQRNLCNTKLKRVKHILWIKEALTTKVAKYSWASIGRNEMNISVNDIQDAFAHTDTRTTANYAKTKGHSHIDDINKRMWEGL